MALQSTVHEHSAFASDWLTAREPADHKARAGQLTEALNQWLCRGYERGTGTNAWPRQIVDIGTGRGSNARFLVPALEVPQSWLALDQDAALLREARERVRSLDVPFITRTVQLTPENLDAELPEDVAVVTASALIDLVSRPWLEALAQAVIVRRAAVLVVLSYSGQFELTPSHPDDRLLQDLVNQHQHGDKGTGAALGPDATAVLQSVLANAGYQVTTAESPWRLDSNEATLIRLLMRGWVDAAIEQSPDATLRLEEWLAAREGQLLEGRLGVMVHHMDLLALPPEEAC